MIDRYCTEEMTAIWSLDGQYQAWLLVELAVCSAWHQVGEIDDESFAQICARASFDKDEIAKLESTLHHDMIAFVTHVADQVGPAGRFIHLGLTSSDVLDSATALKAKKSLSLLLNDVKKLRAGTLALAQKHRNTLMVGRSHGVHAEPTTFGIKVLGWVAQLDRAVQTLKQVQETIGVAKFSGPVGTYAHLPPKVEQLACNQLGLIPERAATQVIARDRHADLMYALAKLTNCYDRIATEVRHLQRTEVLELLEPFAQGQKGSSAMPHKKNPVKCERLCGLSRLMRSYVSVALDNVNLWHERDISHSSNERIIWSDGFNLAHYMTRQMNDILSGLVVDEGKMLANLNLTKGLVYSGRLLVELVQCGMKREDAYALVQHCAMACWNGEGSLRDLLVDQPSLPTEIVGRLDELFSPAYYLKELDSLFAPFEAEGERQ